MARLTEKELDRIRASGKITVSKPAKPKKAKNKHPAKKSQLEVDFLLGLKLRSMPTPVQQFKFFEGRRWKLDFYWPSLSLAVETDGGTYSHGKVNKMGVVSRSGHLTPLGYYNDCCKGNHCAMVGITLLRADSMMVKTGEIFDQLQAVFDSRK
jgi:hypothetical protein